MGSRKSFGNLKVAKLGGLVMDKELMDSVFDLYNSGEVVDRNYMIRAIIGRIKELEKRLDKMEGRNESR